MVKPYFIVGILGNVISLLLCACPIGTFWELANSKSSENFNAIPYIAQLLCKTLWTFYGVLDVNGFLIVTVNSVGVVSQLIFIVIYVMYAPPDVKVKTLALLGLVNLAVPGSVIVTTLFALDGNARETFLGAVCAAVTVAMYAAPFSVIVSVVKTKSVENMPFLLSFFLLLNAAAWFTFGVLLRDCFVVVPNALGVASGSAQVLIYLCYNRGNTLHPVVEERSLETIAVDVMNNSIEMPKCNTITQNIEGEVRYRRSSSLPTPTLDRLYSIRRLMKTPSAYILVP